MGVELAPGQVERLLELDRKFGREGLTFDDVLLVPAESRVLPATYHISGVPITDETGLLVGILTNRDLRFAPDASQPVSALMTSRDLVTAPVGTTLAEAEAILHRHKIEKLPVVDSEGRLK